MFRVGVVSTCIEEKADKLKSKIEMCLFVRYPRGTKVIYFIVLRIRRSLLALMPDSQRKTI